MSASVFFFGGWNASQNDIDAWLRTAKAQKPNIDTGGEFLSAADRPESGRDRVSWRGKTPVSDGRDEFATSVNIAFTGFPYPSGASWDDDSAVNGFKKSGQYKSAVAAIQACSADSIYIVGHSSGCAIANAVDKGLKDTSKVVLVALDGFTPDGDQLKRSSTQVWGAMCGDVKSKNFPGPAGGRRKVYQATDCKTKWALHFSLVNAAATDSLVKNVATGYAQCQANLVWL